MPISQATTSQGVGDRTVSDRVLDAVAEEEGVSPLEFDRPLYDVVDPDALDALFRTGSRCGTVEFTYLGYRVTVQSAGDVDVSVFEE